MLELGENYPNNKFPSNIVEIFKWLEEQEPHYKNLHPLHWDNIFYHLTPRVGKKVYTKSGFACFKGLYEATLIHPNMKIEIGDELWDLYVNHDLPLQIHGATIEWLGRGKIFVDRNTF